MTDMTKWWLVGGSGLLGVLIIASIVLALINRDAVFAPGTPEFTVQDLLRAAEDEDSEKMYAMLSQELRDECAPEDFANNLIYSFTHDRENDRQITLTEVTEINDTTLVSVQVRHFSYDGLFFNSDYEMSHTYKLRQEGGEWKFVDYPWPHSGYCE